MIFGRPEMENGEIIMETINFKRIAGDCSGYIFSPPKEIQGF